MGGDASKESAPAAAPKAEPAPAKPEPTPEPAKDPSPAKAPEAAPAAPAPKPEETKEEKKEDGSKSPSKEKKEDGSKSPSKGKEKGKGKKKEGSKEGKGEKKTEGKKAEKGASKGKEKGKGGEKGKGKELYSGPMGAGDGFRLNVKNMGEDMTEEQLKELFKEFGTVNSAAVKKREDGKSRGFGFVTMSTEEEGKKALEKMDKKEINGKTLSVAPAERRPQEEDAKGKGKKGKGKDAQYAMLQQQQQAQAMYMQWYFNQQHAQAMYMQQMQSQQSKSSQGGAMTYVQTDYGMMPVPANSVEYEGSLKSLSGRNGYGFIVCQETHDKYQRDVYIDKDTLPEGAKVADRIKFKVDLVERKKGDKSEMHPKAISAEIVKI